jgi:hypothetical protein
VWEAIGPVIARLGGAGGGRPTVAQPDRQRGGPPQRVWTLHRRAPHGKTRKSILDPSPRPTFRTSRARYGVVIRRLRWRSEGLLRDAEQGEDLTLEVRQLDVEDLHRLALVEQHVALD